MVLINHFGIRLDFFLKYQNFVPCILNGFKYFEILNGRLHVEESHLE